VISKLSSALREEDRRVDPALSPLERLRLAQRLGDEAASRYARAHGVTGGEAAMKFARRRELGRRPSRCAAVD